MTIYEAIEHCEEKANECGECAYEHKQLKEWLEELVKLKSENKVITNKKESEHGI